MKEVTGDGFGRDELVHLAALYASFMTASTAGAWRDVADMSHLNADGWSLLEDVASRVAGKINPHKVDEYSHLRASTLYGHPHMHDIQAFTEFRPVSGGGEIARIVPYLVVDMSVHDVTGTDGGRIKIQLDMDDAKRLHDAIGDGMADLASQTAEMGKKFGGGVIVD